MFVLLPRDQFADVTPPPPTLPRTRSHHQEWIDACRGMTKTESPFDYAAVLTESLLLGNVALRTRRARRVGRRQHAGDEQQRGRTVRHARVPQGLAVVAAGQP